MRITLGLFLINQTLRMLWLHRRWFRKPSQNLIQQIVTLFLRELLTVLYEKQFSSSKLGRCGSASFIE